MNHFTALYFFVRTLSMTQMRKVFPYNSDSKYNRAAWLYFRDHGQKYLRSYDIDSG